MNLYKRNEKEEINFIKLPKAFFTEDKYISLSIGAKILYSLLLDRLSLSNFSKWFEGELVFVYFTTMEAAKCLSCARDTAIKIFKELEKAELIKRKRQGITKPSKIYVSKIPEAENLSHKKQEKTTSREIESHSPKEENLHTIKTDIIKKDNINTYLSNLDLYEDMVEDRVKAIIEYDVFLGKYPQDMRKIDEVVRLMVDILKSNSGEIKVCGIKMDIQTVKERFLILEHEHIDFVLDRIAQSKNEIKNMRSYLISALFNAPVSMENYENAVFEHFEG